MQLKEILLPKISFGNKKLPKGTMIFNIPAVKTCPFRTPLCSKSCYALKAERIYPQVLPARQYNLDLSKSDDFIEGMKQVITKNQHKINRVRIHESGDFYNQAYFDKWVNIIKAFPEIKFYAYTKSFFLDFSQKPKNLTLIASFDETTDIIRKGYFESVKQYFDNTFSIVGKEEKANCIQDCTKCSKCWNGKGLNLTVNIH